MFVVSLIIIAVSVIIDQILKFIVDKNIDLFQVIPVIKFGDVRIFSLTQVRNSGAAWSIMSGKTWFLVILPIIVCIAALVYMFVMRNKKSRSEMTGCALFVGGGIGNLIDRIRFGEVIDYIQFEPVNFPVFNFADICVVIGMFIFVIAVFCEDSSGKKKVKEKNDKV